MLVKPFDFAAETTAFFGAGFISDVVPLLACPGWLCRCAHECGVWTHNQPPSPSDGRRSHTQWSPPTYIVVCPAAAVSPGRRAQHAFERRCCGAGEGGRRPPVCGTRSLARPPPARQSPWRRRPLTPRGGPALARVLRSRRWRGMLAGPGPPQQCPLSYGSAHWDTTSREMPPHARVGAPARASCTVPGGVRTCGPAATHSRGVAHAHQRARAHHRPMRRSHAHA